MDTARVDCPVCLARDLDPGLAACPSCGTDLGPLWRVRELAARAAEGAVHPPVVAPVPRAQGRATPRPPLRRAVKLALGILALWVPVSVALLVATRNARPSVEEAGSAPAPAARESPGAAGPEGTGIAPLLGSLEGIRGAMVTAAEGNVRIVFAEGIFASGSDQPSDAGLGSLQVVGRTLAAAATEGFGGDGLVVDVVGACDDRPTRPGGLWKDNWSLALGRARAAAEILRAEAGAAPIRWRVSSAGEAGTPWANDTEAGRSRNRTVMLYVAGEREGTSITRTKGQP